MPAAVLVDAVRSPMGRGKPGGALSSVHPVDLLAQVLQALAARTGLDPGTVDDVLVGCVSQNGEQSATPGRQAVLAAGWPEHVPSVTIDRKCGSGQQALDFAVQGVIAGAYDVAVAAGVESMSRVPMGSARGGADPYGPLVARRYTPGLVPQGVSAELVAQKWGLTRAQLDAYAARSHQRAAAARDALAREIVPIETPDGTVSADESIRPGHHRGEARRPAARIRGEPARRALPRAELEDHGRQRVPDHGRGGRDPRDERGARGGAGPDPARPDPSRAPSSGTTRCSC